MSHRHAMGTICTDHGWVLTPDTCLDLPCSGPRNHGYVHVECAPGCPAYDPTQEAGRGRTED